VSENQKENIDLSISIVNTSNWKYLQPCLESIYENINGINIEVLVVDNDSDDGSFELIQSHFPEVILSRNPTKYGFAKNNNINLKKSSGKYLMLLNDDTLVKRGSLEAAINFLEQNKKVGMVGCKMIYPDGEFQKASARKFRSLFTEFLIESGLNRNAVYIKISDIDPFQEIEIDLASEAGMIIRKETFDQVGCLDERFFMYGEGADWCKRIKKAGWKIFFIPKSPIIHFGNISNKRTSLKMYLQFYKSTYLFFNKTSSIQGFIYRLFIIKIFTIKRIYAYVSLLFLNGNAKEKKFELDKYYKALLEMFLFRISDDQFPFPV